MKKAYLFMVFIAAIALFCLAGCGTKTDESANAETAVMTDFSAETLDGGTFTEKDLAAYDLTMVNIWTTWCGYCVEEMPELQNVYDNLPKDVNMIGICCDADTDGDYARDILEENGCSFTVLIPDGNLTDSLLGIVTGYPTTVFVDKDGNMVGDAQVGIPGSESDVAKAYLNLIDERLDQLN